MSLSASKLCARIYRLLMIAPQGRGSRLDRLPRRDGFIVGDPAEPGAPSDRERAGQELLDAAPMPIADWLELKQDLLEAHAPRL